VTDPPTSPQIRPAAPTDYPQLGDVWLAAWRATFDFPPAHPDDDVRRWLAEEMAPNHEVWVAVDDRDRVVGFLAMKDCELDQLYIAPAWIGHGLGRRFVDIAKAHSPALLELYCFQVNVRARRFYERNGFTAVAFGDGSSNEERQPDIRYAWRPDA
jgi:RimJ/RimL family protein N-acetyltransferase